MASASFVLRPAICRKSVEKACLPRHSRIEPRGMQDDTPDPDAKAAPKQAAEALSPAKLAEKQRLAEALRANLRRRKEQTRQRKVGADAGSHDS
jgi:hypothetical protein